MSVNIISFNVRGLGDALKRRAIFNYYKSRADILCLQETHSQESDERIWMNEFGGDGLFSHGSTSSGGVCILMKKQIPYRVVKTARDVNGRIVGCELENMDDPCKRFSLCNIYGPNKDCPQFFVDMLTLTSDLSSEIAYVGDFNLVLDTEKDRKGSNFNYWNSHAILREAMNELFLVDTWRDRNNDTELYSWMRAKPKFTASRIDFSLMTQCLANNVGNIMYLPGIYSDHMALFLNIDILQTTRGRGYWKFNNSLLQRLDFVEEMNQHLENKLLETRNLNPWEKWLFLEKEATNKAKNYSKLLSKDRELIISQLSEKILEMEHKISEEFNDKDWAILIDSKSEIEELLNEKTKGTIFRTKTRWYEESEKNTKFFFNLEKRRYNARLCNKLILENGDLVTKEEMVIKEQKRFYMELYRSDPNVYFNLENKSGTILSDDLVQAMNQPFTKQELSIALKGLKNGKTPGQDCLSADFFKMFYKLLGDPFFEMVTYSYEKQKLPKEMCTGIINLIPKANRDSRKLKNLRPITLLDTCYKIVEKALANRLQPVLEDVIASGDQKGFLRNRSISTNIRRVLDFINYTKTQELDAIILSLDFLKCFDKIEKCAILGSLNYFGFGEYITRWTSILYDQFTAVVQNNGHFSETFPIEKGVHQGGCASTMLFLVCAEVLALELKGNENIQGVMIGGLEHLLGQFADDMDIFSLYDQHNLEFILATLDHFGKNTGFSVNYDKTQVYRVGSLQGSSAELITQKTLTWTNNPINVLGVSITSDPKEILDLNYNALIPKIKGILRTWNQRRLSLMGKVLIINSLIASLFV